MRIMILANRDLGANLVVDRLVRRLGEAHRLSVVLSARVGRPPEDPPPALVELARHEQTLPMTLLAPLAARAERPPGALRGYDELATVLDGRVAEVNRPRSDAGRAALLAHDPDLLVSVRYGGILDARHAAAVPHGILNLHSGRLPHYRGILPSLRALLAGERVLTATLHRIVDAGIDTGPIIDARDVPCDFSRSLLWNVVALYPPAIDMIVDAVGRIAGGDPLPGTPQDPDAGAYFGLPDAATLAEAERAGIRLTDLSDTIELLCALHLGTGANASTPPP